MDRKLAEDVLKHAWVVTKELDTSVATVRDGGADQETLKAYRRSVGRVLALVHEQILEPVFSEHPELKPPGFE